MTRLTCLLVFAFSSFWATAQSGSQPVVPTPQEDYSLDHDRWAELVEPLNYDGDAEEETPATESGLRETDSGRQEPREDRSENWLDKLLGQPWVSALSRLLLLLGAASLLFFLVRALLSNEWGRRKKKRPPVGQPLGGLDIDLQDVEENPEYYDLRTLITRAEENGDLALAFRLHYILALRNLAEGNWIRRKRGKSNHDYLRETKGTPFYPAMHNLTALFDRFFYGGYRISEADYEQARIDFREFQQRIELSETTRSTRP